MALMIFQSIRPVRYDELVNPKNPRESSNRSYIFVALTRYQVRCFGRVMIYFFLEKTPIFFGKNKTIVLRGIVAERPGFNGRLYDRSPLSLCDKGY
jgi:hypothetical protein